jgi:exoribonuclease R
VAADLRALDGVCQALQRRRLRAGSLDFGEVPALRVSVRPGPGGGAVDVAGYDALGERSRGVVSELMVLVNAWAARVLLHHFPATAPLRVQPAPSASRLAGLVKWCEANGIDAGRGDRPGLQAVVEASRQPGASPRLLIARTKYSLTGRAHVHVCGRNGIEKGGMKGMKTGERRGERRGGGQEQRR